MSDQAEVSEGMPSVTFQGVGCRVTLPNGRVVDVVRDIDGANWGLRFGHPTDDEDCFRFALTNEAFGALVTAINSHADQERTQLWTCTVSSQNDPEGGKGR